MRQSVYLVSIGSDNGLSPGRRQAIIWTNAGILSIGLPGTNFGEIWIGILSFSYKQNSFEIIVYQNGGHFVQGEISSFLTQNIPHERIVISTRKTEMHQISISTARRTNKHHYKFVAWTMPASFYCSVVVTCAKVCSTVCCFGGTK